MNGIDTFINRYNAFIFLSPHLDDAVLSCTFLINKIISTHKKLVVITVFTEGDNPPYTKFASAIFDHSGYSNAMKLYKDRRLEDVQAMKKLHCLYTHLHMTDSVMRKKDWYVSITRLLFVKKLFSWKPGYFHLYPTNKELFSGAPSSEDDKCMRFITTSTSNLIKNWNLSKPVLLLPLGIGGHIDHIITRDAFQYSLLLKIYWEDFPYNITSINVSDFLSRNQYYSPLFQLLGDKKYKKTMIKMGFVA